MATLPFTWDELQCQVLVLGSGGAGLMAARHARKAGTTVVLATKALFGKSGCTRMVQGGFNAVLDPADSFDRHFDDTMQGGHGINQPELVRALVEDAPAVIRELAEEVGVHFHRTPDGRFHQKGLAGQSFDRTVHHGDLTGIEIVSRLAEQVRASGVTVLEDVRGIDLLWDDRGVQGALLLDIRQGRFIVVRAGATVLATGGSAPIYLVSSASLEKSGDGYGMAYRAGVPLLDMEMTQFHPTGLVAPGSRLHGSVIAEELRGLGGHLYNALGERFMARYNPERMERATRDEVARASYLEIMAGRGTPNGAVWLDVSHLGAKTVEEKFPGMWDRCRMVDRDLRKEPIEVAPTSHFHMGGVVIDAWGRTPLPGLLAAGEDAGGVHGANRLGGNGVADATVFGRRAGQAAAEWALERGAGRRIDPAPVIARATRAWRNSTGPTPVTVRASLKHLMWTKVGVTRRSEALEAALEEIERLAEEATRVQVTGTPRFNLSWQEALNLDNALATARLIARAALVREESRGAHFREDFPEERPEWQCNIVLRRRDDDEIAVEIRRTGAAAVVGGGAQR